MDAISYKQKEYLYSYFRSKPPELNLHLHKYYEFLYFISGDATYIVEDNLYKIHPGDILLTRPGELHTIFFQSEKPYERIFMQIHPDLITEFDLFDKINSSPIGENNRIPSDINQSIGLYVYFKNIKHYILNRVPESDAMIKSYFLQFLVAVNHALDNTVLPIKPTNNNRIDDIIDYLTDNISADITLDFLAEKFFIKKYYIWHSFKKQTDNMSDNICNNVIFFFLFVEFVVICFQISIFEPLETTRQQPVQRRSALWFAFKLVSLNHWKQQLINNWTNKLRSDLLTN